MTENKKIRKLQIKTSWKDKLIQIRAHRYDTGYNSLTGYYQLITGLKTWGIHFTLLLVKPSRWGLRGHVSERSPGAHREQLLHGRGAWCRCRAEQIAKKRLKAICSGDDGVTPHMIIYERSIRPEEASYIPPVHWKKGLLSSRCSQSFGRFEEPLKGISQRTKGFLLNVARTSWHHCAFQ